MNVDWRLSPFSIVVGDEGNSISSNVGFASVNNDSVYVMVAVCIFSDISSISDSSKRYCTDWVQNHCLEL